MPRFIHRELINKLLGRAREMVVQQQIMANPATRLLTITGPGGVGKTTMALHTADRAKDAYLQRFSVSGTYKGKKLRDTFSAGSCSSNNLGGLAQAIFLRSHSAFSVGIAFDVRNGLA